MQAMCLHCYAKYMEAQHAQQMKAIYRLLGYASEQDVKLQASVAGEERYRKLLHKAQNRCHVLYDHVQALQAPVETPEEVVPQQNEL